MKAEREASALTSAAALLIAPLLVSAAGVASARAGLDVQTGSAGLKSLSFQGVDLLANGTVEVYRAGFRKLDGTTYTGRVKLRSRKMDRSRQRLALTYEWGEVSCTYTVSGNRLDLDIRITNKSRDVLRGIAMQLMEVRFPKKPKGRGWANNWPIMYHNSGAPTVLTADYGDGVLTLCNNDLTCPIIMGFQPAGGSYSIRTDSSNEFMKWLWPHVNPYLDRPIYPGQTDVYSFSLRFGPAGSSAMELAGDIYARFLKEYPYILDWKDRRLIAALFISTSDAHWPKNPRGWFLDKNLDVTTDEGRAEFRQRILSYADGAVKICKDMNSQGVIVWDPEGQEYPHATSYIGDPRSLPPEMRGVADEFFRRFRDAGLRTGVCLRPQLPAKSPYSGGWGVNQLEVRDPFANLDAKITYTKQRWGCTLFYVDSNGDPNAPVDSLMFRRLAVKHPDVLLIPEHENVGYFSCTAPLHAFGAHGVASTPASVRPVYPQAFSCVYIADGKIDQRRNDLVDAVRHGDILLYRGWFDDPDNKKVKSIYAEAGRRGRVRSKGAVVRRRRAPRRREKPRAAAPPPPPPKPKPRRVSAPPRPVAAPEAEKPRQDAEIEKLFKKGETLFIQGDTGGAAKVFRGIAEKHAGTDWAAKAEEYLEILE